MDTNKKILIGAIGAAVVIGGVAIGLLLSKTPEKADLSTIHTEAATEAPKETLPAATQAPETEETTEGQEDAASSVSASIETYTSGKVSIQYPAVDQMDDASKKDKINELLKTNALSFIKANDIDESNDTLDIKCKVISVDRKRLTATYTGTLSAKEPPTRSICFIPTQSICFRPRTWDWMILPTPIPWPDMCSATM